MKKPGFKVLMLDLDGTLLKIDMKNFIESYVLSLSRFFAPDKNPEIFSRHFLASTRVMIENQDRNRTIEDVFFTELSNRLKLSLPEIGVLFDRFFEEEYPKLRCWTSPHPHARNLIDTALDRGVEMVLATKPVFPLAAIRYRLQWAGILDCPFILVTTIENMHFCKPNPGYYLEILEKIGRNPAACLMAGNNAVEDMAAAKADIATFLVEDHVIIPPDVTPEYNYRGSLNNLRLFIEQN